MSVTDEIKSRIDIVEYIQRFVPSLKKSGRNYKACCPFHSENTPSFVVNPARQTWRCFGACAEGGDLFTFAQKANGWDFKEALRELGELAGVQVRPQSAAEKSRNAERERLRGLIAAAAQTYHRHLLAAEGQPVRDYAHQQRGLTAATLENFQIGYAPDRWDFMHKTLRQLGYDDGEIIAAGMAVRSESGRVYDRFRKRLMIPIRDERGRAVGFGGRVLDPQDNPKYINSPQSALFDKSRLLFGLDSGKAAIRATETVVIAEGYLDVIQAHQAGYYNVVAQMGTAMTEAQLRLVAPRYAKKIVLALDADPAGQNAARRSLEVARQTLASDFAGKLAVDVRILQIPAGKDPDDFLRESPDDWLALVDAAQSVADFVIAMETASLSPQASLSERQQIAQQILPILRASEDNLYQQENIQKLARRLRISERELLAWAQTQSPAPSRPHRAQPTAPPDLPPPDFAAPPDLPPEYWDNEYDALPPDAAAAKPAPKPPAPRPARAIEPYCLSLLLKNPNLLYQANRKLRELADNDENLLRGPLCDLGIEDFSQSEYRILMGYFQEALTQDDMEPLEYMMAALDSELRTNLKALFVDEFDVVSAKVRGSFPVDLRDIFKKRHGKGTAASSLQQELISRALQLRRERLEQERLEMQYLQEEAQTADRHDPLHHQHLSEKILLSIRAKARIDLAFA